MLSNGVTLNVVHHDLDLHFQGKLKCAYLENGDS